MDDEIQTRDELLDPYRHPYRRYLPVVWHDARLTRAVAVGGGLAAVSLGTGIALGETFLVVAAVLVLVALLVHLTRWMVDGALVVRRFGKAWDEPSELGAVRAHRPHAGEVDPHVVHPEFAVTVEDSGRLFVWRFTPLAVVDDAPRDAVLVPGRPRYAAEVVEEHPFDRDPAVAAEQLVELQERAASLEDAARRDTAEELRAALERRELERETSSTAAALQHLTGQSRDRRG